MRRCTLEDVARYSGGRLLRGDPQLPVDRLHTDTRTLAAGDCFVALQGDRFDGHNFVGQVRGHGAVAALVSHRPNAADVPADLALVEVTDTLEGLQRFAAAYRALLPVRVIGVTGSSGKTSTKELIASVLRSRFETKATEGNLNNHIGVPLTLIRLDGDEQYCVVEMGMNHPGEIAPLVKMAAPEIGVISSIGPAHIEFFEDQAAIAAEKAELIAGLPPEGLAVLNSDDEWSRRIAGRTHARVAWVGSGPDSTWRAEELQVNTDHLSFRLRHNGSSAMVRLPVVNRVMVSNALLAAAVGRECGLTMDEIARGLEAVKLPGARMQVLKIGGAWIVNDSYNANPDSMKAALTALCEFPHAARRLAVLGSMGELGLHATALHFITGEYAAKQGVEFLIAVGPHAEDYARGAIAGGLTHQQIVSAPNAEEAATIVKPLLREGDAVLVKGSHFMGLERLVAALSEKEGA
jgi:UDP-N-acetylmuramoyl-tripeptide--D-alanyl-D-alanine ligase